nr:hemolysin III family protein [uncultured Carboxylicivirga sp.]
MGTSSHLNIINLSLARMKNTVKYYSKKEENLNVISHLIGVIAGLIAYVFLISKSVELKSLFHLGIYTIYALCILTLFLASTLYHNSKTDEVRMRLKIFDHCAIYLLIAGSYVPFVVFGLNNAWGYWVLAVVWVLAIAGIILKLFFTGRFKLLSTISYVLLGWIVVIASKSLIDNLPAGALYGLAIGGAFYTVGAVLYMIKRLPYNHAIFHFFVLGGAFAHFWAVYFYL